MLDRAFEIAVNCLTAIPFYYWLIAAGAIWLFLCIIIFIDV